MIRKATLEDVRGIAIAHVRSWQFAYRNIVPDEFLNRMSIDELEARRRKGMQDPANREKNTLVAVDDETGRILGFSSTGGSRDDEAGPGDAELMAIYLHPSAWGRGLGRALLDATLTELREQGFKRVTLWVLKANLRALHFYEAAGFQLDGATSMHRILDQDLPKVRLGTLIEQKGSVKLTFTCSQQPTGTPRYRERDLEGIVRADPGSRHAPRSCRFMAELR